MFKISFNGVFLSRHVIGILNIEETVGGKVGQVKVVFAIDLVLTLVKLLALWSLVTFAVEFCLNKI